MVTFIVTIINIMVERYYKKYVLNKNVNRGFENSNKSYCWFSGYQATIPRQFHCLNGISAKTLFSLLAQPSLANKVECTLY